MWTVVYTLWICSAAIIAWVVFIADRHHQPAGWLIALAIAGVGLWIVAIESVLRAMGWI